MTRYSPKTCQPELLPVPVRRSSGAADTYVNIMDQYRPVFQVGAPTLISVGTAEVGGMNDLAGEAVRW